VSAAEVIKIPRDVLQKTFDTAVGSMDFGSGFLDNEEVDALRAYAVLLGVDVAEATPEDFKKQYGLETAAELHDRLRCRAEHSLHPLATSYVVRLARCSAERATPHPDHLAYCCLEHGHVTWPNTESPPSTHTSDGSPDPTSAAENNH
jgi:hypothetical protein